MRVLLQNAILTNYVGKRLNEKELKNIIIEEYQILDDKFKISNEYEKSQIISELYKYLVGYLRKHNSFNKPSDIHRFRDDFLVVKLDDFIRNAMGIDLENIINNDKERYKDNRGVHCKYCSSKDICLRIAQN